MFTALAAAIVVGYAPGAALLAVPGRTAHARRSLPVAERLFWRVLLSAVWSTMAVLALGAIGRYSFSRLLAVNVVIACVAALPHLRRWRPTKPTREAVVSLAVPAGLIALGWWLYFPGSEYVIGGRDPGTYINAGVQIAQRGSVIPADPAVGGVPPPLRDLFFPSHQRADYYGLRFMGFFIRDPGTGSVVSQFPHFYPASVAIGYGLGGLTGARNTIGVWAILGVLAVYFAGASLFGRTVAAVAAGLLAINVVTVWFARYPNSEVPMQALVFAALLAIARNRETGGWYFGAMAGVLLGLTLFLRYEVLIAIATVAAVATLAPVGGSRLGAPFTVGLVVSGAAGLWYLLVPMQAYSAYPLGFLRDRGGWVLVLGVVAAVVAVQRLVRIAFLGALVRRAWPPVLACTLLALATYAYFLRQPGGGTAPGDAMAFRSFAWYVSPAMLAVAVAGTAAIVWRRYWTMPVFLSLFAVFSVFFFYKTRIVPEHFWTSRRFLGMALPGTVLLAAAIVHEAIGVVLGTRLRSRAPIAVTCALVLAASPVAWGYWQRTAPVARHVEYAGLIPHLETLAAGIGERDLVVVESRNAGSDVHVLAVPLAYIYAKPVLVLDSRAPDKRQLETFVAWADARYDRILFLGGGGTDLLTRQLGATPLAHDRFQVPEHDAPVNAYPTGVHRKEFEYGLYHLTVRQDVPAGPIDLRIGERDDLNVVSFHAREVHGATGVPYRWSRGRSAVLLPNPSPDARRLTVWLSSGGRPPLAPAPVVTVMLGAVTLGTVTPRDDFAPFTFDVPVDLAGALAASGDPARLELRVDTWNPTALAGGADRRDLGVIVSRVTLE